MINGFEAGKVYMFTGTSNAQVFIGEMKDVLDGKPRKCIYGAGDVARFEGMKKSWIWYLEYWEEVPSYTWTQPFKRGDRIEVWDDDDMVNMERIFLTYIEGTYQPFICVHPADEDKFNNGEAFETISWQHAQRIPEPKYEPLGEEQMKELVGKKIVQKSNNSIHLVTGYSKVFFPIIYISNGETHNDKSLLKNFTYLDGYPCGVEES